MTKITINYIPSEATLVFTNYGDGFIFGAVA